MRPRGVILRRGDEVTYRDRVCVVVEKQPHQGKWARRVRLRLPDGRETELLMATEVVRIREDAE